MPRPPVSESREDLWLDLVADGWTTAEIAELSGLTQRRVQQRLAKARDRRAAEADPEPMVGGDDVWLELVDQFPEQSQRSQQRQPHGYYDLGTDATSLDGTTDFVLVGTGRGRGVRRNRLGTGRHVDTGQRYQSDDDGLKGGTG